MAWLLACIVLACMACTAELSPPLGLDLPGPATEVTECAGVGGGPAILHGDPRDPHLTWEADLNGTRIWELLWPPGYVARFAPTLEGLDSTGTVVAREGDRVPGGGCVVGRASGPSDPVIVLPAEWAKVHQ